MYLLSRELQLVVKPSFAKDLKFRETEIVHTTLSKWKKNSFLVCVRIKLSRYSVLITEFWRLL